MARESSSGRPAVPGVACRPSAAPATSHAVVGVIRVCDVFSIWLMSSPRADYEFAPRDIC